LSQLKNKAEDFERERLKNEFAEIERKVSDHLKKSGASSSIRPDDFLKLRKTIDQAKQMLEFLEKQQLQEKALKDELQKELNKLNNLWHEEFKAIETELQGINKNQSTLKINVEFKGDKESFARFMKDIFKGSNIRQITFQSLSAMFADFAQMYLDPSRVRKEVEKNSPVFEQYFTGNLKTLLTWQVPDKYTISYRDRELKHHSLGQRASALMLFILSQRENDVIIIDQPEDDLDNQTIYEDVIKLIRQMKIKTQFIFATHNANIPVLGDAEQVHSSRYSDEKIQLKNGSIDDADIQKEIVDIMEGGEERSINARRFTSYGSLRTYRNNRPRRRQRAPV
jgi:chromosome segregation protein